MERFDNKLNTFNTAKKYAEEILFPKMDLFQIYQRKADFGANSLDESLNYPEEFRDIQRFNGLKGMAEILHSLLNNISSTVRLKNNQIEISQLENLITLIAKIKKRFYEQRELFFISEYKLGRGVEETLDREYFEKTKEIINQISINTEMLMTKNKLIFSDASDDYLSDQETLEKIKSEYTSN